MDDLKEFLTISQQQSISDYIYIHPNKLDTLKINSGDYVKFMYRYNYKFMEGGIVINIDNYPVVKLKSYGGKMQFYNIDLSKTFVFYKKNRDRITKRQYFEELLNNLKKK